MPATPTSTGIPQSASGTPITYLSPTKNPQDLSGTPVASATPWWTNLPTAPPGGTPAPTGIAGTIPLSIDTFTNAKNQTPPTFTITGKTAPLANVDIEILPDAIYITHQADNYGSFRFILTKTLTEGTKKLKVTATTNDGSVAAVTKEFVVKKSAKFPFGTLFLVIILGGGAFFLYRWYKKRTEIPFLTPTDTSEGPSDWSPSIPEEKPAEITDYMRTVGEDPPKEVQSDTNTDTQQTDNPQNESHDIFKG